MYDFLVNGLLVNYRFFHWPAVKFITSLFVFAVFPTNVTYVSRSLITLAHLSTGVD